MAKIEKMRQTKLFKITGMFRQVFTVPLRATVVNIKIGLSMKTSTRYAVVRIHILHTDDVDPDDVVNEADYSFNNTVPGKNEIVDTEIIDISEECPI